MPPIMDSSTIYKQVEAHYGSLARAGASSDSDTIAKAFGYSEEDLRNIPRDSNLGVSCGNPLAIATLREGETVIDFGSGAGFDVFLAAKKVGPKGRAIGVDMNKDMLARARANHANSGSAENISFVESQITSTTLEAGIADCIISNCVINLVPDAEKPAVFAEMARLLKPGGRIAVSDILAKRPLPKELRESVAAYVGCVAGCSLKGAYEDWLTKSGFQDVVIVDAQSDLNVYTEATRGDSNGTGCKPASKDAAGVGCCSRPPPEIKDTKTTPWDLADIDINEWAGSYKIFAVKA